MPGTGTPTGDDLRVPAPGKIKGARVVVLAIGWAILKPWEMKALGVSPRASKAHPLYL
jgi:hypothetical protein